MRRSRAERGFSVALATFAVVLAIHIFLQSPFFRLQKVTITGAQALSEAEVVSTAGFHLETSLFDIDLAEASKRLLADPRIAEVHFKRRYPSGLLVSLVERQPVAVLALGEHLWQVDAEGRLLAENSGESSLLMITTETETGPVEPGDVVSDYGLRIAASLAGKMPQELALLLSEIHVVSLDRLELLTRDGTTVHFGAWEDVEQKAQVLLTLLTQVKKVPKAIDISNPLSPVVR